MRALPAAFASAALVLLAACADRPLRVIQLRPGVIEVTAEMVAQTGVEIRGAPEGTVLHLASDFHGRAAIVITANRARIRNLTIDGNRDALEVRTGLPPYDRTFSAFTTNNGILALNASNVEIRDVRFRNMAGFAILVSHSQQVLINRAAVLNSGSRNPSGRNNATGGILLEEGTTDFTVEDSALQNIRGNGIWTHSLYTSPRNSGGLIIRNWFDSIGRDAIQIGHAYSVQVDFNAGARIGFPVPDVDAEGKAIPVAIDTAGNVEATAYNQNRFTDIDGKCIDLDGFHDGEITGNLCRNTGSPQSYPFGNYAIVMNNSNPDMQSRRIRVLDNLIDGPNFGAIFVIGEEHLVSRNRFLNLNRAHCNEDAAHFGCYYAASDPEILEAGIYLGRGAERPDPARHNRIERNEVTGFKMDRRCIITAPGLDRSGNQIVANSCSQ